MNGLTHGILFLALLTATGMALLLALQPASSVTDNITVNVTVNEVTEITVTPTNLSYAVNPGANSSTTNISVQNTGSVNVTNIYISNVIFVDEAVNPAEVGNPALFGSTGFIMYRNESTSLPFYHVGRMEWNITVPSNTILSLSTNTSNFSVGWYRTASGNWFLWKAENGTDGFCNNSNTTFTIKTEADNSTLQQRDFTATTTNYAPVAAAANGQWTTFSQDSGPLKGYCVAVYYTCNRIEIFKFDNSVTFPTCANKGYVRAAVLTAGQSMNETRTFATVPTGTPAGATTQGQIVFTAT